jgi:hypothetical protein
MPFKLYHNERLLATFEDRFMESLMKDWQTEYVSAQVNMSNQTLIIWIENKIQKKEIQPVAKSVKSTRKNKNLKSF